MTQIKRGTKFLADFVCGATFREIGENYGLSGQRVKQIIDRELAEIYFWRPRMSHDRRWRPDQQPMTVHIDIAAEIENASKSIGQ